MSEEPTQIPADAPSPEARIDVPPPVEDDAPTAPGPIPDAAAESVDAHPEFLVGGAFVGAFLLAKILRRIGGAG